MAPARIGLVETHNCTGSPCVVAWACTGDRAGHRKTVPVTYGNLYVQGMQDMVSLRLS